MYTPKKILDELKLIIVYMKLILGKKKFFKISFKRTEGRSTGYIRIQQIVKL